MNFSRFLAFSAITGPAERKNSLQMRRFQTISEFSHGLYRFPSFAPVCADYLGRQESIPGKFDLIGDKVGSDSHAPKITHVRVASISAGFAA